MPLRNQRVLQLGENDVSVAVDVLCDAFEHYPVMLFVLDAGRPGYRERLRRFVHFAVMARMLRGEFLFGIADAGSGPLQGVATVSRPSVRDNPPELTALREAMWTTIGADLHARYEAYGAAVTPFTPPEPHLHINMLGVRHAAHGRGYARPLLEHVHALSQEDSDSSGVSLTTEVEANVAFYEHFGYRLLGKVDVTPGVASWGFFRPNTEL